VYIPTTVEEIKKLNWKKLDVIFITGDSYIDSSYMGIVILGKYLIKKGFKVGIILDGRMSGASGIVPSAIHLSPEAIDGGLIAKIQDDDLIEFDVENGIINILLDKDVLEKRKIIKPSLDHNRYGLGRELFVNVRANVCSAKEGATIFKLVGEEDS